MIVWQGESCNVWRSHHWVLVIWGSPSSKGCQALCAGECPWERGLSPAAETITHSPSSPSPAVPSFLKGCLAERLLLAVHFPSQGDRDASEPSHLSLCVFEGLLVQHFSLLLCFLWWKPSAA